MNRNWPKSKVPISREKNTMKMKAASIITWPLLALRLALEIGFCMVRSCTLRRRKNSLVFVRYRRLVVGCETSEYRVDRVTCDFHIHSRRRPRDRRTGGLRGIELEGHIAVRQIPHPRWRIGFRRITIN